MKKYYSVESQMGSQTSHGFANDKIVFVFNSKAARDEYVATSKNLSCKKILASDATKCAANYSLTQNCYIQPKKFSGEFWAIVSDETTEKIIGCIGYITVSCDFGYHDQRLF